MYRIFIITLTLITCSLVRSAENLGVEQEIINYVDELDSWRSVPLFGDILVLQRTTDEAEMGRSNEDVIDRCLRFLTNHELKLKMPEAASRGLVEGRTRKLKRLILPLLILLKLKAAIVVPALFSIIAFVAFRGLESGLLALAIAGAIGLKSLLETHHHTSKLTYEVVPQLGPSPWSRSGIEPLVQGYHTLA